MELQDSAFAKNGNHVGKAFGVPSFQQARRAQAAHDVMALKGSGRKTLKAMEGLRPKPPKGKVAKNDDPFELEKSFGSAFKFATKTVSANARVLGAAGKNAWQNKKPGIMRGMRQTKNTVTGNARAMGAVGAHGVKNASIGTKVGLAAGGGAAAGGGGMYAYKKQRPF